MRAVDKLKPFLDGAGQVKQMPAKRKMQNLVLWYLASQLPEGPYTERELNELLLARHTFGDPCTLRRDLYDGGFLDRTPDGRQYWKRAEQPTPAQLGWEDEEIFMQNRPKDDSMGPEVSASESLDAPDHRPADGRPVGRVR